MGKPNFIMRNEVTIAVDEANNAMIINKSAYERGFAHGAVYKSYLRDLNEGQSSNTKSKFRLIRKKDKVDLQSHGLDADGLPYLG